MVKCYKFFYFFALSFLIGTFSAQAGIPVITVPPANTTVCSGNNALFYVQDTASAISYIWKVSMDGGVSWDTVHNGTIYSGANSDSLIVHTNFAMSGYKYRCVAANTFGLSIDSTTAKLTVDTTANAGIILGASNVCKGGNISLSDSISGGSWSNSTTSIDTINIMGVVYGLHKGTDTIKYTKSNTCGAVAVWKLITVDSTFTLDTIQGGSIVCVGSILNLMDSTPSGNWMNMNHAIDTINNMGQVFGISAGTDSIKYIVANSCMTATVSKSITINPLANPGIISGATHVCIGSTLSLTDSITTGTWSNAFHLIDTVSDSGRVYAIKKGTDTIKYTVTNSCGPVSAWKVITIDSTVIIGSITGAPSVCVGASSLLTDSISGGIWSNVNHSLDTVNASGLIYGLATGIDTVKYTISNTCNAVAVMKTITINTVPAIGIITGTTYELCLNTTITLTDSITSGTWSNGLYALDTVNATGIIYAKRAGIDTIYYSKSNSCGTAVAKKAITVDSLVAIHPIAGASNVCFNGILHLTDSTIGGVWSNSFSTFDTISSTGIVYGLRKGIDTISYAVTNLCGSDTIKKIIYIDSFANPGIITKSGIAISSIEFCFNSTDSLSDTIAGGVWSHSFAALDSVNNMGVVYGIRKGIDTIKYGVTNVCGTMYASVIAQIDSNLYTGVIAGMNHVCVGSTISLTDAVAGGTWSILHPNHDSVGVTGILFGKTHGLDTVIYTLSNTCGVWAATKPIIVDSLWIGGIGGSSVLCVGSTDTLTDSAVGGTWSSNNHTIATISTMGVVYANNTGIDTIVYVIVNSCGSTFAVKTITINPLPNSGSILGLSHVCNGSSITLNDSITGGTWSSNIASNPINASGVLTTTIAGLDTIYYTVTNSCGSSKAWKTIMVDTAVTPSSLAITGASRVCVGSTIIFTDALAGGIWWVSNPAIATITSTGNLFGLSGGTANVKYIYTNSCGSDTATSAIIVDTLPNVGSITGASVVCLGNILSLTDTVSGGVWNASNTTLGTISTSGIFTTNHPGWDTVSYSITDAHCTAKALDIIRIDTAPTAEPITGASTVCVGSYITLMNSNIYGSHIWSVYNSNATINASGMVSGLLAGQDTVIYQFTNSCGSINSFKAITVQGPLTGGVIIGSRNICHGSQLFLTDSSMGGIWLSSNPLVASMDSPGVVTGRMPGMAIISYTSWNSCGSVTDTFSITVDGIASSITGMDSVGVGLTRVIIDSISGGNWVSTQNSIATINGSGTVTGVMPGIDTIVYTVTNTCGTSSAYFVMIVGNQPALGTISGPDTVCVGHTVFLNDTSVLGGIWTSSNNSASVNAIGLVTGLSSGLTGYDTIYYTYANGFGSSTIKHVIFVNTPPVVTVHKYLITVGGQYPLIDSPTNGVWTSSNDASITFHGNIMIVLAAADKAHGYADTLIYTVTNPCGATSDTIIYTFPFPASVDNNNEESSIKVFPNPSNGNFNISFVSTNEELANVIITNMVGQKIEEFSVPSNKLSEFKLDQPEGIYMLSAISATKRIDVKLVITK